MRNSKITRAQRAAAHRLVTRGPDIHCLDILKNADAFPEAFQREAAKAAARLRFLNAMVDSAPATDIDAARADVRRLHAPEPCARFSRYDAAWARVACTAAPDDMLIVHDDPRIPRELRVRFAEAAIHRLSAESTVRRGAK